MPITFSDLLDGAGWEPLRVDQADPSFYWDDSGFMTSAPVDVAKTFDGAIWASTTLEPAFGLRGRRLRAGFTVPTRHHNLDQLTIVVGGEMTITFDDDGSQSGVVRAGGFWIADAKTPYSLTTGAEGVSYIECWPDHMSLLETYWHDDPNWVRR